MSTLEKFEDIQAWQKARKLSFYIYKKFSNNKDFSFRDQLRRATVSISNNIAEGFGRFHYKDKIKFYYNSRGSVCEVQNFLFLSRELDYIKKENARKLFAKYENLNKRINSFISSVNKKSNR